jgi:hypothetical protein
MEQEWDTVLLVLMDEQYELMEIYEAQREQILDAVGNPSAKRPNRSALTVAKFKHIGKLVWSVEPQKNG